MAWLMVAAFMAMTMVIFLNMRREAAGKRADEFHELVEMPKDDLVAPRSSVRPYSSTFQRVEPEKPPAIKILAISDRP